MIRSLPVVLLAFVMLACSGKNKIPKGILPQSQMESVLWDMISADEFVAGYVLLKDPSLDKKQESLKLYDQVYSIHKTNKEEFQKSLSFYQSHPYLLMDVLDSINAKHSALTSRPSKIILADTLKLKNKVAQ
jgi:hypothetical protein